MNTDNFEDIILKLKSVDENDIITCLLYIKELKNQKKDITCFFSELIRFLIHENSEIRWMIAELYDTPQYLLKLKDCNVKEKIDAIENLALAATPNMIQDRSERDIEFSMPFLTLMLLEEEAGVRLSALETIGMAVYDNQDFSLTIPGLLKNIKNDNDEIRLKIIFIIRSAVMSPYKMLDINDFLSNFYDFINNEKNEKIKWAAADVLTYYFASKKDFLKVEQLLKNDDKDVRQEAAGTLTRVYINISPLIKALKKLLHDKYEDVRLVAARTLVLKAKKCTDVLDTIDIVVKMLDHSLSENRIYASSIVYNLIIFFVSKQKKKSKSIEKLSILIEQIIPFLDKKLHDTEIKVVENISVSLARYYLTINQSDKLIDLMKKSSDDIKDKIIKNIEPKEILKPEKIISYIAEIQCSKLGKKLKNDAKKGLLELNISAYNLSSIKLFELPKEIGCIKSLKKLNVSQNKLRVLPDEISELENLEDLVLTCNELKELPTTIGKLMNLKYLWLYRNKLKTLPKEIKNLKELRMLQLIENEINTLPNEIGCLENLTDLNLERNNLKKLPFTFGNMTNLKRLDLRSNKIKNFSSSMDKLINLEQLMLDNNDLYEIPDFVFKLLNLKYLSMSYNKLTEIPVKLYELKNIETLELRNNQIKVINPKIRKLRKLRHLDLNNNKLSSLPVELKSMYSLSFLHVRGNNLNFDSKLSANGRASEVFKYIN